VVAINVQILSIPRDLFGILDIHTTSLSFYLHGKGRYFIQVKRKIQAGDNFF